VLVKVKDTLDNEPKQQVQPGGFQALFGQPLLRSGSSSMFDSSPLQLSLDSVLRGLLRVQPLEVRA